MNRQQLRAYRAVMRRIARIKNPEPMLVMHAFAAARARGWAGPDTKKATAFAHPKVAKKRTKVKTGFTKVWTQRKARRFAQFGETLRPYPKTGAHAKVSQ